MNSISRLIAGTLGAGVLAVTAAGTASATTDQSDDTSSTSSPASGDAIHGAPSADGTPSSSSTTTYLLPGVAAPLPTPAISAVPKVLEVVVTPLAALSDITGESGPQPGLGSPSGS